MPVHRLLVTGDDAKLVEFNIVACLLLNPIARKDQTILYTCLGKDRETAFRLAKVAGVEVQELEEKSTMTDIIRRELDVTNN